VSSRELSLLRVCGAIAEVCSQRHLCFLELLLKALNLLYPVFKTVSVKLSGTVCEVAVFQLF